MIKCLVVESKKLNVIDFFCGAGGFSEGFRQMGFNIKYGYDNWKPAIDTFNFNFNLKCEPKNILDFKNSIYEIELIPDTEIIIGSPPCVSFSSSNKSGNADKSLGVELTEVFLKIVAVKKHQPGSKLKAWFMENVVNSKRYLQSAYTFKDLGLTEWANKNRISPLKIAIDLYENTSIINSADYGSFQARKRLISGEIIKKKKLIVPVKTHSESSDECIKMHQTLMMMKSNFPVPFSKISYRKISDPQYPLTLPLNKITDHFYDTGVYKVEWHQSRYYKINHPFMGKMSFPENEKKPSRTITATKIANSRETILYRTEINRIGDGEYRLPTVREAAIIMGFPLTYQFIGKESSKWRLVGNAVCCSVSRVLAKEVLIQNNLQAPQKLYLNESFLEEGLVNLNNYSLRQFNNPPIKKTTARFRRHPIKDGNLTVTLSNYDIEKNIKSTDNKWFTSVQYGTGEGFPIQKIHDGYYKEIESIIEKFKGGKRFIEIINNGFSEKIGNKFQLQDMYEKQKSVNNLKEPTILVDEIAHILEKVGCSSSSFEQIEKLVFEHKSIIPIKQFFALYAVNKISSIANIK
jgi:DNA (cytosine-5)-methyltransferase 1